MTLRYSCNYPLVYAKQFWYINVHQLLSLDNQHIYTGTQKGFLVLRKRSHSLEVRMKFNEAMPFRKARGTKWILIDKDQEKMR